MFVLQHTYYVWDKFISAVKAKNLYILAHSFGGHLTANLLVQRGTFFLFYS
jgi:alpha-beta hydrolase superfamily lysophospholipase